MNPDPIFDGIVYEMQSFSDDMHHIKLSVYSLVRLPVPELLDAVSVAMIDAGAVVDALPTKLRCAGANAYMTALSATVNAFELHIGLISFGNNKYTYYIQILTDNPGVLDAAKNICKYIDVSI
jgi:hypothetical protein